MMPAMPMSASPMPAPSMMPVMSGTMPGMPGGMMPQMGMMPMMPHVMGMMPGMMMPGMMPQMGMMPHMMGMGMMPHMMGMMPQMMGMMPGMMMPGTMPQGMARMAMEMGKDTIVCRLTPMEGMSMDMLRERGEAMMKMMAQGMPLLMMCGNVAISCMPATKA